MGHGQGCWTLGVALPPPFYRDTQKLTLVVLPLRAPVFRMAIISRLSAVVAAGAYTRCAPRLWRVSAGAAERS